MKMLDLFSGIGGFSLAAQWAGIETVQFVEIDPFCQRVLAKNFAGVPIHDDIKSFSGDGIPAVDIITGGFPCQDVSIAGKGAGLDGERTGLFWELLRVIEFHQPAWFALENVPGILSNDDGRTFAAVLSGLEECGYGVAWRTLDAQYFGVAGTRRRVFFVGSLGSDAASRLLLDGIGMREILPQRKAGTSPRPMCVGWDGGLSYERLRQCVITETDAPRTRARDGVSRRLDKPRYRAIGNAIVPQVVYPILQAIKEASE